MWNIDLHELYSLVPAYDRLYHKKSLLDKHRPLPAIAIQKLRESLSIEWTYNSNSIEGNSLTLRETHLIVREGITIRGKSLREHFEAYNHEKAIEELYKMANSDYSFNVPDILTLHGLILRSIEDEFAGRFRTGGVRISGANFTPPNALKVPALINELVDFVNSNPLEVNDILLATIFHHRFVWIHPFFDGNGRTVRLAMNLLLISKGFPPAIILKNDRKRYYDALNDANKGSYYKLALLMAQALERTLDIYMSLLPDNEKEYLPISTIVSEPDVPYGEEYISLLARRGKIDAYKDGRNWLTTKEAIAEYMINRKRERKLK